MKKYTPRLIAILLLAVRAAVYVIPNYEDIPLLVCVGVVLAGLTILTFAKKNSSLVKEMPWFASAAILIFIAFPAGTPDISYLGNALQYLIENFVYAADDAVYAFSFLALVAMQIFLRKKENRFFIVLRYVAAYLFLSKFAQTLFGNDWMYRELIAVVVILSLIYELNGVINGILRPRMLSCLLFSLCCFVIPMDYGYHVADQINSVLNIAQSGWLYTSLAVAIAGLLIGAENRCNSENSAAVHSCDQDLGGVLLCWSLLTVVMHVWDDVMNTTVLFMFFPFVYHFYCLFLKSWRSIGENSGKSIFPKSWIFISLGLLAFSKGLNYVPFAAMTMLALAVAGSICWAIYRKSGKRQQAMNSFFGVAAVILIGSIPLNSLEELQRNVPGLLVLILICVMWCFICAESHKIDAQASSVYPTEYKKVIRLQGIVSVIAIVFAAFRVLIL